MFELRTACSYLVPRRGQLSISVVGLIAVSVISAITWLVLVFFSTTEGIETRWSEKIIGAMGSMRVVPTQKYYESPLYAIDFFSEKSSLTPQRLSAKVNEASPPYNPSSDTQLPSHIYQWYQGHETSPHPLFVLTEFLDKASVTWRPFESTVCHLAIPLTDSTSSQALNQYTYLIGIDHLNPSTFVGLDEISPPEIDRILSLLVSPSSAVLKAIRPVIASIDHLQVVLTKAVPSKNGPLDQGTRLSCRIDCDTPIPQAILATQHGTTLSFPINTALPFSVIAAHCHSSPLALPDQTTLAYIPTLGYPALLPKQMRAQGARLFETGTFEFSGATISGKETFHVPLYVAGFFDPGILPVGGKLVITSRQAVMAIQPALDQAGPFAASGLIIDARSSTLVPLQQSLQKELEAIAPGLFSVERFDQYDVTSELYQQLSSEKTLFRLLSIIIIIVACSNIFSMLFILAHDRRKEIAVLRALGASKRSITLIFLLAGLGVGLFGSLIGSTLAIITLHYLSPILDFIGTLQGHEVLHKGIYGDLSSQAISISTVIFAFCSVCITSALAGTLAAVRACTMNVSEALRSS